MSSLASAPLGPPSAAPTSHALCSMPTARAQRSRMTCPRSLAAVIRHSAGHTGRTGRTGRTAPRTRQSVQGGAVHTRASCVCHRLEDEPRCRAGGARAKAGRREGDATEVRTGTGSAGRVQQAHAATQTATARQLIQLMGMRELVQKRTCARCRRGDSAWQVWSW